MSDRKEGSVCNIPPFYTLFLPEKHKVQACKLIILWVYPKYKTLNHLTDFNETRHKRLRTGGQLNSIYNFLLTNMADARNCEAGSTLAPGTFVLLTRYISHICEGIHFVNCKNSMMVSQNCFLFPFCVSWWRIWPKYMTFGIEASYKHTCMWVKCCL